MKTRNTRVNGHLVMLGLGENMAKNPLKDPHIPGTLHPVSTNCLFGKFLPNSNPSKTQPKFVFFVSCASFGSWVMSNFDTPMTVGI